LEVLNFTFEPEGHILLSPTHKTITPVYETFLFTYKLSTAVKCPVLFNMETELSSAATSCFFCCNYLQLFVVVTGFWNTFLGAFSEKWNSSGQM